MTISARTGSGYLRAHRHLEPAAAPADLPQQRFDAWWALWQRSHENASQDERYRNRRRIARECGVRV